MPTAAFQKNPYNNDLLRAVRAGDVAAAEKNLARGASVNALDAEGLTPLIHAARGGDTAMVGLLLKHHAARDCEDENGGSALLAALAAGQAQTAAQLLKEGFNAAAINIRQETALTLAATTGLHELFAPLQAAGAAINARDSEGRTPAMCAFSSRQIDVAVPALLALGAEINPQDKSGRSLLMYAVLAGRSQLVDLLLAAGARTDLQDNRLRTALDLAKLWHQDALAADLKSAFNKYDVPQFNQGMKQPVRAMHPPRFRPQRPGL